MASLGYFSTNWMDDINNISFMEEIDKKLQEAAFMSAWNNIKDIVTISLEEFQKNNPDFINTEFIKGAKSLEARDYWLQTFPESEQVKTLKLELFKFSEMGLQLIRENKKLKEQLNGNS